MKLYNNNNNKMKMKRKEFSIFIIFSDTYTCSYVV